MEALINLALKLIGPKNLESSIEAIKGLRNFFRFRIYITLLQGEDSLVIFYRFAICTFAYTALQILMFSNTDANNGINLFSNTFKFSLIDLTLATATMPGFLLGIKFTRTQNPFKILFGFIFILRYLLLSLVVIFYSMFLATEEYAFTIPRALFYHSTLFALLLVFPLSYFTNFKQRMINCALYITPILLNIFLMGYLITRYTNSHFEEYQLLYDPIGVEVDKASMPLIEMSGEYYWPNTYRLLINSTNPLLDDKSPAQMQVSIQDFRAAWDLERAPFALKIKQIREEIALYKSTAKFRTAQKYIDLTERLLNESDMVAANLDEFYKNPNSQTLGQVLLEITNFNTMLTQSLDQLIQNENQRNKLRKYWIIS